VAVLGQCPSLAYLRLGLNDIGAEGAGRLAAVLGQCPSLAYLALDSNDIGAEGLGGWRRCWGSARRSPTCALAATTSEMMGRDCWRRCGGNFVATLLQASEVLRGGRFGFQPKMPSPPADAKGFTL